MEFGGGLLFLTNNCNEAVTTYLIILISVFLVLHLSHVFCFLLDLNFLSSGDTFTDGSVRYTMTSMNVPEPVMSLAISPVSKDSGGQVSNAN